MIVNLTVSIATAKAKEQFEDTIFYTNVDYMNNLMSSINGKNPKSGDDDEEEHTKQN